MNARRDTDWSPGASETARRDDARIAAELVSVGGATDPFVAAVRATRMPMIVTDPRQSDNPVVFANDAFCRLSGYPREEILGRNCRFLQGPETDPAAVARIRAAVAAARPIEIDIRNHRKNREVFWNRLLMAPVRDADGALVYFFASQVDVTIERDRLVGLESHNAALMAEVADRAFAQHDSEARLRFAAEAGRLGIWELEVETGTLTASPVCKDNFGRRRRDPFTYADLREAIHPDDRARVEAAIARSLAEAVDYDIEYRVVHSDGAIGWVQVRAQVVRAADGAPGRMAGVSLDITARKRDEARRLAFLELGDRIRDVDDPADLAFAAAEILGRSLGVSRAGYGTIDSIAETITIERDWNAPGVASIAGLLRFREYGSYIEDLKRGETVVCADADLDPRTASTAGVLKAISAHAFVNMPVTEQGDFVALLFLNHATAREWPAEELSFIRDVAERTRTAVERRRAEHDLREFAGSLERQVAERTAERDRVWRNSRDLLVIIDADGVFRAVNPAWTTILGHAPSEVVGRGFMDSVWPDDANLTQGGVEAAIGVRDLTDFEKRHRHKDGTPRWISWHTSVEGDLVFASGRHITADKEREAALREAEEKLRQSQKMEAVGQLTGGVAHDFNNLLQIVVGNLEILQRNLPEDAGRLRRSAENAMTGAQRAATLTQRLLAFSRRQPLAPKPIDANALVGGMSDLLNRALGETVALETVLAGGLWRTEADPNQLESAILNLAVNARDAMPNGGKLTIETANAHLDENYARANAEVRPGQYVLISVSDTGSGMDHATLARVFEPFFTTKEVGKGTGLGLAMVYGFVKQSDGHVKVYSEGGQGTTVKIYLPRRVRKVESEDVPPGRAIPEGALTETVLVVEDDADVRAYSVEVLRELGYGVLAAVDGPSALKLLERAEGAAVRLLFTDVVLPGGMTGAELAREARRGRPGLKVLFTTGYARNAIVHQGRLDEGVALITKPFTYADLAAKVRDVLDAGG